VEGVCRRSEQWPNARPPEEVILEHRGQSAGGHTSDGTSSRRIYMIGEIRGQEEGRGTYHAYIQQLPKHIPKQH
jgi:hypothetical protein